MVYSCLDLIKALREADLPLDAWFSMFFTRWMRSRTCSSTGRSVSISGPETTAVALPATAADATPLVLTVTPGRRST